MRLASRVLGRIGSLEVRLASDRFEVEAAQEVRYRVFFEERGAADAARTAERLDADRFDELCDHVLVFDQSLSGPSHRRIVGTYRLLRQDVARQAGGFYSQDEFDMDAMVARHPDKRFVELGRSCVLPAYRSKRTIEALWQGIWGYVQHHDIDVMAGCASFEGVVPAAHAEALTLLSRSAGRDPDFHVRAHPHRYVDMDLMPIEAVQARSAFQKMPPLIKGYLRLGASVGEGCVIDRAFRTVDVFIVMPITRIDQRYIEHYSTDANRYEG